MAKMSLSDFYKSLVKFVDNNPDLITNVGIAAPILIKLIKSGAIKGLANEMIAGMKAGLGAKEALSKAVESAAVKGAMVKGAKAAAVVAAAAFAFGTIKEAVKGGQVAIKEDEPGWKKIVDFAWNTSIPGATVNQFRAFGKWLTKKPSTNSSQEDENSRKIKPNDGDQLIDQSKLDAQKQELDTKYDQFAASNGMVPRPSHPTAETEWQKEVEKQMRRGSNDPKWYKAGKYNGLKYAGELSFDLKNGDWDRSPLPNHSSATPANVRKIGLPSVGGLDCVLTIGKAENDLIQNLYTDVTVKIKALNKNSALTSTWTRADLFKLVHTMRVLYAGWCIGRRAFKLINEYDSKDLTLPHAYFAAMGLDYVTWRDAKAQIQEDLLTLSSMIQTYVDWGKLDLFKRTQQMFDFAYKDGKSYKAQTMFFTMSGATMYYRFNSSAWQRAIFNDHSVALSTGTGLYYSAWKNMFTAIIDALYTPKVQDMLSCLRYVYGTGESIFRVPGRDERLDFVYNPEVQSQIENASVTPLTTSNYTVADDATNDWVTETITLTDAPSTTYVNTHVEKLTQDEQIVATRLMTARLDNNWYYGTEVAANLFIYQTTANATANIKNLSRLNFYNFVPIALTSNSAQDAGEAYMTDMLSAIATLVTFDWAPLIRMKITTGTTNTTATTFTNSDVILNGDWENIAIAYTNTATTAVTWMSFIRNGNYSLHSEIQTRINNILDKARTA